MKDEDIIIYISDNKQALINNPKSCFSIDTSTDRSETLSDLHADGSGRGWKDGAMDLNIIRPDVYSTELVFTNIEENYFVNILKQIKPKVDGGFYASIFFDEIGQRKVLHMYRGDRSFVKHRYRGGWRYDLSVSIIEI